MSLPNEVIAHILWYVDADTLNRSVSQIPTLSRLMSIKIHDSRNESSDVLKNPDNKIKAVNIHAITSLNASYRMMLQKYHFFQVEISNIDDDDVYMAYYRLLNSLKKYKKSIVISFLAPEISMNYLKMFKSLFHDYSKSSKYFCSIDFVNLRQIKSSSNHLLVSHNTRYPQLVSLNLYYCSSKFYCDFLDYLNLDKHPSNFPGLKYLKIQDYMNEEEDVYSLHSNNFIKHGAIDDSEDCYDDYDYNSDLDENEFFFDGLEIIQNLKFNRLKVLILQNCNISKLKNINAPKLEVLKIFELSNKHIEENDFDLWDQGLDNDSKYQVNSFIASTVSTKCSLRQNSFPNLRTLKIVGHLKLTDFSENIVNLNKIGQIVIKGCNIEIIDKNKFLDSYAESNSIKVH